MGMLLVQLPVLMTQSAGTVAVCKISCNKVAWTNLFHQSMHPSSRLSRGTLSAEGRAVRPLPRGGVQRHTSRFWGRRHRIGNVPQTCPRSMQFEPHVLLTGR